VWEYDTERETITLVYESTSSATLESPDNVVVVPKTGHIFLQEDSDGEQFTRGVTRRGEIYDFAESAANESEFCGGCFDPHGQVLFLNQQGERGNLPAGPPNAGAVTYAIWGPWKTVA
jgi:secreted PhoX family phosphatase